MTPFLQFALRFLPVTTLLVLGAFDAPVAAQYPTGIDVSHWQGNINWTSVKNSGVSFAFVKATEGIDFVDSKFHANMQGAKAAGVLVGAYHFCRLDSYVNDPNDAINEANDFLEAILPYYQTGTYLPPVADVEAFPPFGSIPEARAFTSAWVTKFSDTIYNAIGVRPIIYQSLSKANSYYTPAVAAGHELWLAWWKHSTANPPTSSDTPLWGPWQFWQWTDAWSVPGIAGPVDGDLFNGTMSGLDQLLLGNDGSIPGDFDRDGAVDAADYLVWKKSVGQTVPLYTGADASGNARVDAADLDLWRKNFGSSGGGGGNGMETSAVPEPASLSMLMLGTTVAIACARRKNCRTQPWLR